MKKRRFPIVLAIVGTGCLFLILVALLFRGSGGSSAGGSGGAAGLAVLVAQIEQAAADDDWSDFRARLRALHLSFPEKDVAERAEQLANATSLFEAKLLCLQNKLAEGRVPSSELFQQLARLRTAELSIAQNIKLDRLLEQFPEEQARRDEEKRQREREREWLKKIEAEKQQEEERKRQEAKRKLEEDERKHQERKAQLARLRPLVEFIKELVSQPLDAQARQQRVKEFRDKYPGGDLTLRSDLVEVKWMEGQTLEGRFGFEAGRLLMGLPSPMDRLDPEQVPRKYRPAEPIPGLVAVLGTETSRHGGQVLCLSFSPDGQSLASGAEDGSLRLWDLRQDLQGEQRPLKKALDKRVTGVTFSPDSSMLFAGGDARAHVLDLNDSKLPVRAVLRGNRGAFSPDGSLLAVDAGCLYKVPDWTELKLWGGSTRVRDLSFSPDGHSLAIVGHPLETKFREIGSRVALLAAPEMTETAVTTGLKVPLNEKDVLSRALAYSPDGRFFATTDFDGAFMAQRKGERFVYLWTLRENTLEEQLCFGHTSYIFSVAFSPDATIFASSGQGQVILWSTALPQKKMCEWRTSGVIYAVAVAPDGRHLAIGNPDGSIFIVRIPRR
jgi:WD domain, G-beta repeat